MTGKRPPRLPYGPLVDAAGRCSQTDLAVRVRRDRRMVQRWAVEGLTVDAADRAAVALNRHPVTIWGSDRDTILAGTRFR